MSDSIADFPLRGASIDELGVTLARCYGEYNAWHGQAVFVANFAGDAQIAGVHSVVADRVAQSIEYGEATGIIVPSDPTNWNAGKIADDIAQHQIVTAEVGVKTAAVVMLHNACERFIWRLVRFGAVAERERVLKWIADRKVAVATLSEYDNETLIDQQIEKWWEKLERDSLPKKWDVLVKLFGFPETLQGKSWHFSRDMLCHFDDVRHNAVHHDGRTVQEYEFVESANQQSRAMFVWLGEICKKMQLRVPADVLFGRRT